MIRRFPKFCCGVLVGTCTTLVGEVKAIPKKWDSARVSGLEYYRVECIYTGSAPIIPFRGRPYDRETDSFLGLPIS